MNAVLGSELTTKLEEIRSELSRHRDTAASLVSEIDKVIGNGSEETQTPSTNLSHSKEDVPSRIPKGRSIIQQVLEILNDGRHLYTTPALLKELAARGHAVRGKRPIQTLYGVLHKDMKSPAPRVVRSDDGYWHAFKHI